MLLTEEERRRVKGLIINKFRGDKTILDSGTALLERKAGIPVTGVVPFMELSLDDEDSLTQRFDKKGESRIDLAVIRYPRISNFTDFNVFEQMPDVSVRYVTSVKQLHRPDMVILPGSKNTMGDLRWMRETGLGTAVQRLAREIPVFGICGGYQMLGQRITDPEGVEEKGELSGLGLLPVVTELKAEKTRCQKAGTLHKIGGIFAGLSGLDYEGYEIHVGETSGRTQEAVIVSDQNVYGTYMHGIFDKGGIATTVVCVLAQKKGILLEKETFIDYQQFKETQYDKLADTLKAYLDMEGIYGMLRKARLE